jgi:hypothetical protein
MDNVSLVDKPANATRRDVIVIAQNFLSKLFTFTALVSYNSLWAATRGTSGALVAAGNQGTGWAICTSRAHRMVSVGTHPVGSVVP